MTFITFLLVAYVILLSYRFNEMSKAIHENRARMIEITEAYNRLILMNNNQALDAKYITDEAIKNAQKKSG